MPSETDLLNDSLGQIGATPITAIDDGTINANHCQRFYPALRDGLLRTTHWNFAIRRAVLAQEAATPAFEFAYSYALPGNPYCLKVVQYYGATPSTGTGTDLTLLEALQFSKWKVEGRHLLTNDGEVEIVYIARVTNPDEWDSIFYQLVSTWLAAKLANAIPKDHAMATALLKQAVDLLLPLAAAVDGQEGSVETLQSNELIEGR